MICEECNVEMDYETGATRDPAVDFKYWYCKECDFQVEDTREVEENEN